MEFLGLILSSSFSHLLLLPAVSDLRAVFLLCEEDATRVSSLCLPRLVSLSLTVQAVRERYQDGVHGMALVSVHGRRMLSIMGINRRHLHPLAKPERRRKLRGLVLFLIRNWIEKRPNTSFLRYGDFLPSCRQQASFIHTRKKGTGETQGCFLVR